MARFGQGVNASLGKTDYSNYLAGALEGARGVAGGGQAIGQGIANLGQSIGTAFKDARKRKDEKEKIDGAVTIITPMAANAEVRQLLGIPDDATDAEVKTAIRKGVISFGADNFRNMVEGYRGDAAFSAGMDASNRQITESIASTEMNDLPSSMTSAQVGNFNVPSSIVQDAAPQSVEDFLNTGKLSTEAPPSSFNDFMDANGINRPQAPEAVQAQETAQAPKSVIIPDDLKDRVGYNSSTGKYIPRDSFTAETSRLNKALEENELKLVQLRQSADTNSKPTATFDKNPRNISRFGAMPVSTTRPLTNDEQIQISDSIQQRESERQNIKKKLADQNTTEIKIAELNNPKNINKPPEEKASNIIDKAFAFAQENDLPDLDLQEWKMMKDVIKEVKRDATDEEKTAAFVAAYSKIAPINASAYSKIEKIFDKTPAITDLGNGKMVVSIGGQSFLTNTSTNNNASWMKLEGETAYNELLSEAQRMGLEAFMVNPELKANLNRLHNQFGPRSKITNERLPLELGLYSNAAPSSTKEKRVNY
jgi:hypothetical protein